MKRTILLVTFCSATLCLQADTFVTKGALVEGLFILQNKHQDLKEFIQLLKKELTECFSQQKADFSKNPPTPQYRLEAYHCKLKQYVYPAYIDELGRLAAQADADIKMVEKDQQIEKDTFDAMMKRAFHLDEKIGLDKQLLETIFLVDRMRVESGKKKVRPKGFKREATSTQTPTMTLAQAEKKVSDLKTRSIIVNANLFVDGLIQEVFLDKLVFFRT